LLLIGVKGVVLTELGSVVPGVHISNLVLII
jgi:hypothetical protein